ncbi:uncharacterized protein SOCE26_103420 [Sorangium cellulosum]|uniref:Peptidase S8/S53 domain-containing protein n=2 Tax=Sorangium cellulosum TaxID=56 RepID=A0A2L0FBA1_SORCE|nr:uncharacterized protein SOCE26_103420 [Sorangium cellulosum]
MQADSGSQGDLRPAPSLPQQSAEVKPPKLACAGELEAAGQLQFESLGATARGYLCRTPDSHAPRRLWVDDGGEAVSLDDLRIRDAWEFASKHAKIEPTLRERLRGARLGEKVLADLWFFEDGTEPPKEEILASPELQARVVEERNARHRGLAQRLSRDAEALRGSVAIVDHGPAAQETPAPFVTVRATPDALRQLGALDYVAAIRLSVEGVEEIPMSDDFFSLIEMQPVRDLGFDGTGIIVAHSEGARPDSWLQLDGSIGCTAAKCACPNAPQTNWHPRSSMGVIRNLASTHQGVASGATVISANHDPTVNSGCTFTNAVSWATGTKGATVINRSAATSGDGARYLDYLARNSPYPFVAASVGNDGTPETTAASRLRNGMVVGGALDFNGPVRGNAVVYPNRAKNPGDWELPHLVAPTGRIATANHDAGDPPGTFSGTSAAAPIISGIAAALQEANSSLKSWPEAMFAGLMVSADEDVDGHAWALNLNDDIDDSDGAGLVSAENALAVLQSSSKVNGGNTAQAQGHDYGTVTTSNVDSNGVYTETWRASSAHGDTLRVAAILFSTPSCTVTSDVASCPTDPFPRFTLSVRDVSTSSTITSAITAQNYQYVAWKNTSGSSKTYEITLTVDDWQGVTSTTFSTAWMSSGMSYPDDSIWLGKTTRTFDVVTAGSHPSGRKPFVGDFDRGLGPDIYWYAPGNASDFIWYGYSYHEPYHPANESMGGDYVPVAGDFDDDGSTDIFWYASGTTSDNLWWGGDPDGANGDWSGARLENFTKVGATQDGVFVPIAGDFDGDGYDDIFWYAAGAPSEEIWWGSSSRTWTVTSASLTGTYVPVAGDFDGDNKTDIFWHGPGTSTDYIWWGSSSRTVTLLTETVDGSYTPLAGDFDGDTRDDIYWYAPGTATDGIWYGKSNRTFD